MSFVAFTTAEVDADSPLNETFFTKMKDNFDALDGQQVTNGDAHNHSGGDGGTIGTDGVVQGSLKTAMGAVSAAGAGTTKLLLPGGEYGFYPQIKSSSAATNNEILAYIAEPNNTASPLSYGTYISLGNEGGHTGYAQQRYIQASPPYKIGNQEWGHFLYMLVNAQGDIIASYEAEDPPYAYNGPSHHKKDSIERIQAAPHPFVDYWDKDPVIDGVEIVLVDLREYNTKKWRADTAKTGKGILEDLGHINRKGGIVTPQELGIVDVQGFTDKVKIRKHN